MCTSFLKASGAPPGQPAPKRQNPAERQPSGGPKWNAIVLIVMGLLVGCGGPSQQVLTAQALSQRQAPNPNKDLQQPVDGPGHPGLAGQLQGL